MNGFGAQPIGAFLYGHPARKLLVHLQQLLRQRWGLDSASGLAGADASFEAADPLPEHVPLLHRTPRCVLRLASPAGALVERPPFLVDRARVRRVVDGEPRAASLGLQTRP